MENTSYIALSREAALWRQMESISNNLANMNTPAFKGEHMMFREFLMPSREEGSPSRQNLAFVQDVGIFRDHREGPLTSTGNPLDVAIHGDGFFVIDTPEGTRYSRNGHFRLDESGQIVTTEGHAVMAANDQPFFIAPNEREITVAADGTVTTENGRLGKIRIVRFENEQTLRKVSGGMYETMALPTDVERPNLAQGMIEESNVQPVVEMTAMIDVLRNYQSVQKVLENEHDRQRKAIDILSRTQR